MSGDDLDDPTKKLKSDPELFFLFQLAEHLHKSVEEVMRFSVTEIEGWVAYFNLKQEKTHSDNGYCIRTNGHHW